MALTQLKGNAQLSWLMEKALAGFRTSKRGPESRSFSFAPQTVGPAWIAQLEMDAGGIETVDLTVFTDLEGDPDTMALAFGLFVVVAATDETKVGGWLAIRPSFTAGLVWFWGNSSLTLAPGAGLSVFTPDSPVSVEPEHRCLDFRNPGSDSVTAFVAVLGGD
jgi:hypothetical protein